MNLHYLAETHSNANKRRGEAESSAMLPSLVMAAVLLAMLATPFLIMNYRVSLNADNELMTRRISEIERKFEQLGMEMRNLELERESLGGWSHVRSQIKLHQLPLRIASANQVFRIDEPLGTRVRETRRPTEVARVSPPRSGAPVSATP